MKLDREVRNLQFASWHGWQEDMLPQPQTTPDTTRREARDDTPAMAPVLRQASNYEFYDHHQLSSVLSSSTTIRLLLFNQKRCPSRLHPCSRLEKDHLSKDGLLKEGSQPVGEAALPPHPVQHSSSSIAHQPGKCGCHQYSRIEGPGLLLVCCHVNRCTASCHSLEQLEHRIRSDARHQRVTHSLQILAGRVRGAREGEE